MLDTQELPTADLHPFKGNPRKGNVALVAESLSANGQYRAIVVNKGTLTGRPMEVLAGNHTLQAAVHLGWDTITAHVIDVDEATGKRIMLVDNRANDVAEYDNHALLALLEDFDPEGLIGTGFDVDAVTDLFDSLQVGAPGSADLVDIPDDDDYVEQWAVTVMCKDAEQQQVIFERLRAEGLNCRVVTV